MSTIVTRSGKGVPLTATDHDNNVNNLNTDKVETLADLSITSTATEINLLDGVTATTAELNYVDGVTSNIQTQLGTKLPLAGGTMTGTIAGFTSTGIDDNATSTAITIDASENVGIGTATPTSRLEVSDIASSTVPLRLDTSGGAGNSVRPQISMFTSGSTNGYHISTIRSNVSTDPYGLVFTENATERMRIDSAGDVTVSDGNLVIGTSGKGIDFSATSDGSGTMTSEVLDDYETGTWTPTNGTFSTWTTPTFDATYTKIGRLVTASFRQTGGTIAAAAAGYTIFGLPYAPRIASTYGGSVSNSSNAELGFANVHTNSSFYFTRTINAQTVMSYTVTYETA
jgi:hypothetical protein